jgi:nitrate reductase NapE component
MGKLTFPWLAMGMGLLVAVGLVVSGVLSPEANYELPLLTMMIVNEFGFFVTAIGAGIGINTLLKGGMQPTLLMVTIACSVMAVSFLFLAIRLWPGMSA